MAITPIWYMVMAMVGQIVLVTYWWSCVAYSSLLKVAKSVTGSGRSSVIGNIGKEWSAQCDLGLRYGVSFAGSNSDVNAVFYAVSCYIWVRYNGIWLYSAIFQWNFAYPDSKVHGANMGPIWGRQNPGGPHVGPMNFAIWVSFLCLIKVMFWWGKYWLTWHVII